MVRQMRGSGLRTIQLYVSRPLAKQMVCPATAYGYWVERGAVVFPIDPLPPKIMVVDDLARRRYARVR